MGVGGVRAGQGQITQGLVGLGKEWILFSRGGELLEGSSKEYCDLISMLIISRWLFQGQEQSRA